MAGNSFGKIFRLTSFGESHGPAIGGVLDGCPAGLLIDHDFIKAEMARRKTGSGPVSSTRKEDDRVEFLSGIFEGKTTGTPLAFIIRNQDQKPEDYDHLKDHFRPSHADYTYQEKYGIRDHRGGGRSSARETAIRVAAGAIAKLLLKEWSIGIKAYVSQIGNVKLSKPYIQLDLDQVEESVLRCPDKSSTDKMLKLLETVKEKGDSAGGTITCVAQGVPAGLGEPVYDRIEAELARAMMSINAVKGFDIGSGIMAAEALGSKHNDRFQMENGKITTKTNFAGGVLGGITTGQDVYFRTFFKPVATIMQDQKSVNSKGESVVISGKGRHDVCIVPRAVPIVEAMAALTIADFLLRNRSSRL